MGERAERALVPLLIGEPTDEAIISPEDYVRYIEVARGQKRPELPARAVLSFRYTGALNLLKELYDVETCDFFGEENRIYTFEHEGAQMCFAYLPMGAPAASSILEELMALGVEKAIFFGGVGALKPDIRRWQVILPDRAVRDEGTSYHYQEPSVFAHPSGRLLRALEKTLTEMGVPYVRGAVWTTDAPYRETRRKRELFTGLGAICVDMEAAALFSVASFRRKEIAGLFYAGDLVADRWDPRHERELDKKRKEVVKVLLKCALATLSDIGSVKSLSGETNKA